MELVVGVSLIAVVIGAIAVITTYSLRNSQFSKNQALATKFAQQNLEFVRTIKSANYDVCLANQQPGNCSSWESIWSTDFGTGTNFVIQKDCTVRGTSKTYCLKFNPGNIADTDGVFTKEVIISNEARVTGQPPDKDSGQKRVTSRVYWTDTTGQHSSDLVTVFSKI